MLKIFRLHSFFAIILFFSIVSYSQGFSDLSGVNFSDLNSSQIDLILRRATSQGYNQFDLLKIAQASQTFKEPLDGIRNLLRKIFFHKFSISMEF